MDRYRIILTFKTTPHGRMSPIITQRAFTVHARTPEEARKEVLEQQPLLASLCHSVSTEPIAN